MPSVHGSALGSMGEGGCAAPQAISAGENFSCAITRSDRAQCWGTSADDRPGTGSRAFSVSALRTDALGSMTSIGAGPNYVCLGSAVGINCRGANGSYQLGTGDRTSITDTDPAVFVRLPGVSSIAAGWVHTCASLEDGNVFCWGDNSLDQLTSSLPRPATPSPTQVLSVTDARKVVAASAATCALTIGGQVKCWGGVPVADSSMPETIVDDAVDVVTGASHACARSTSGRVRCWGRNNHGQLGDGSVTDSTSPIATSIDDAIAIGAGYYHTCAVRRSGDVVCWGANEAGQLGDGTTIERRRPVAITGIDGTPDEIDGGADHTCARVGERLWCWGDNTDGELGDGTMITRTRPYEVAP